LLLCNLSTLQSQRAPCGDQILILAVTLHSVGRGAPRRKLDFFNSTVSDEQSHPILAPNANSFSLSTGRSTVSSGLPLDLGDLKNVHYEGGVPWMLIPDDNGVPHIAILTEISPPVTRNVATDVRLNLFTRYVLICF